MLACGIANVGGSVPGSWPEEVAAPVKAAMDEMDATRTPMSPLSPLLERLKPAVASGPLSGGPSTAIAMVVGTVEALAVS